MNTERFLMITSQFNEDITANLTKGAKAALMAGGIREDAITVVSVPGAFELPSAAAKAAAMGRWQAIICLGCLIQGESDHYHYIANAVAKGLTSVGIQYKLPVIFGVLTTHNKEQALARSALEDNTSSKKRDGKVVVTNKGQQAAVAALTMLKTFRELEGLAI